MTYIVSNHARCDVCGRRTVQVDGRGPAFIPGHRNGCPELEGRRASLPPILPKKKQEP